VTAEPLETSDPPSVANVDSRRRITLGHLADEDQYLVTKNADGSILLEPVVIMSRREAAFWAANPDVKSRIEAAQRDPNRVAKPYQGRRQG
jgi:hypothetical protein